MGETILQGAMTVALIVAVMLFRRHITGDTPSLSYWVACLVGAIAVTIGTTLQVSGVLLALPVVLVAAIAIVRGGWWLGDSGLFLIVLGIAAAAAYLIASALNPDTGSFGDQGALALVVTGAMVSVTAIVISLVRARRRRAPER